MVEGNDRGVTGSAELSGAGQWRDWTAPCASVGNSFTVPAAASTSDLVAVCVMGGFASPLSKSAPAGATLGSSWLYFSGNGGDSFQAGPELAPRGDDYSGVLASPSPGVVFIGRYGTSGQLVGSFDGGHHWEVVYGGSLFYLGFTSPSQGVGLVRLSGGNGSGTAMIMSFDGGHHWARVKF